MVLGHMRETQRLSFPRDHGRHQDCLTEWWYVSGHLNSNHDNVRWGYHFIIFRRTMLNLSDLAKLVVTDSAHVPGKITEYDSHGSMNLYVGQFTLTNINESSFVFSEQDSLSLSDDAGSLENGLDVWIKHWRLRGDDDAIRLVAEDRDFAVNLLLMPGNTPVLHGRNGIVTRAPSSDKTSYYYSMTSMQSSGFVKWQGNERAVKGNSWMDREFGTGILHERAIGWDWFALTLDNKYDIMLYRVRYDHSFSDDILSGTIILPDGVQQELLPGDFQLESLNYWTSSATGGRYPIEWLIRIDTINVEVSLTPNIMKHELSCSLSIIAEYWEGPVECTGSVNGDPIGGKGYMELVGYTSPVGGKI